MKFRIISDVHIDVTSPEYFFDEFIQLDTDKDTVLLLAGDIGGFTYLYYKQRHKLDLLFSTLSLQFKEVLYIIGNHESYGGTYEIVLDELVDYLTQYTNIRLLNNDSIEYDSCIVIGSTLWSNYENENPISKMSVKHGLNDYRCIRSNNTKMFPGTSVLLHPDHVLEWYKENVNYLTNRLEYYQSYNKPIIVMTHHAPSFQSISSRYIGSKLNGGYASDLEYLMEQYNPVMWIHGHMHAHLDYTIYNTRVLCNPFGYGVHEDTEYNPTLVVDI